MTVSPTAIVAVRDREPAETNRRDLQAVERQ